MKRCDPSTNFLQLGLAPGRGSDPKKKGCDPLSTISVSSAWHLQEVQTRKKKCDPLSTISVSSAKHVPEVQTRKKKARSTLQNFCQLGLAPARPEKKSAIHSPRFLSARPGTCKRFRPEKKSVIRSPQLSVSKAQQMPEVQTRKKSAVHSPQFLSTQPSTCPRFRPEKVKSAITLHNFCQLGLAPARGSDPKK